MYTFSLLPHFENLLYIGPPLDAVELKNKQYKTKYFTHKLPIGCPAANPGSKKASYTKSPKKAENC